MKKALNTVSAFQFFQLARYSTLILIGIVFAKTALTQSEIGEYETFVFVAGALSFFWLNGLLKALLPIGNNSERSKTNIFSAFLVIQAFSLLAALLLYFLQPLFSQLLLNRHPVPEINLLLAFIILSAPASLVEHYYLLRNKNKAMVIYAIISFGLQLILVLVPVVLGFPIKWALIGLVLSAFFRYAWLWILLIVNNELFASGAFIREHLKLGSPLVIATLLGGSAQFVDGFIVTSRFSEEAFAIFRYGARELPLAMLMANALSSAMLPAFANDSNRHENLQQLKASVTRLMHFLFPLTAVLLLVSKPLFPLVFNPGFAESATVFNVYLLLIISRLMMPQTILNGLQITKPIMLASVMELILNVSLSLVFVQFWGLPGIAFATFIAFLFEKIYLAYSVKKRFNISIAAYLPVGIYTLYSLGIVVIFIFAELIY
ncbi:oligosaccharide flippase family protein [Maribellus luteus]|uniref:oligosaccharide flippase family protein n=1 Tax=Maribellus luteus TaxID=2305463 RepID=UPI001390455C|nr:oligosaccharide flippase family protein [Maribellus luteus]